LKKNLYNKKHLIRNIYRLYKSQYNELKIINNKEGTQAKA